MIHRRDFLKTSTLATAGILLMPSCLTAGKDIAAGVQLYTVRDLMAADALGTLKKVAAIGYKKVETAGYDGSKIYGMAAAEFKQVLADLGLQNVSGHFMLKFFQEEFEKHLDFWAESGLEYAVLPWLMPEQRATLDQYKEYADLLNACGEKAKSAGVKLAYHNHDFEFQELEGELPMNVLLKRTDPGLVDIELDIYWTTRVGVDAVEFFRVNSGRVTMWHVKDMSKEADMRFAPVGTGRIDFKAIFEQAALSGMKHYFVEQDVSDDPMASIQTSFTNLKTNILG